MNITKSQPPPQFLVVGIGASAGGIEALQAFFSHVPAESGCAYVVILHLSPEYESKLDAILKAVAPIPVTLVTRQVRVEPNHAYVVPPSQHLTMADGDIQVSPNTLPEERRAPVDLFFRTLADSHDSRAVCVVLSGSGSDGSMGLKRVKERGGTVFVQNPREAAFADMPRSAIATNLVDEVLPVAEIPARITTYQAGLGAVSIPIEPEQRPEEQQQALREIFAQLRLRTGHDFANYKRPTLLRRIERRITVRDLPNLPAYASFLHDHPDEVQALLKDLLISVTNFFRDREAFAALEQDILPGLFQGRQSNAQIRVWVVGCATGEEAYSLAMLCAERTMDVLDAPSVQVFASDIDEAAIAHAREGLYTASDLADVSPERLRRFFTKEDDRYRVRRELREMVLFANHNILKDPPFSHIDLVSCRNVLIYLNQTAQERVLETLHFALNPGGYLFLGTSESVDGSADLFATVNREHHIYQHRMVGTRPLPLPEALPTIRIIPPRVARLVVEADQPVRERIGGIELHQQMLEQYAPPSLVVTPDFELVHVTEGAGRYLQMVGEPSANLLQLVRPELRPELRVALAQAVQHQANVDTKPLPIWLEDRVEQVTIRVRPMLRADNPAQGYLLVLFEAHMAAASDAELVVPSDEPATRQLEQEVTRLKRQLRISSEEYEYQAEELKATNEELQATIEELRSSTEELETSKEELQSVNEELRTVNQELKVKIDEATLYSTNLQNLVNSAEIGTIFLDRGLHIRLFTPAARALFNLIPSDYGRPLSDITHRLLDVDVLRDAERVLASLQTIEREVRSAAARTYIMRVLPYRAGGDRIGGVVITFFDITERTRAEEALHESLESLQRSEEQFRRAIEEAPIPVIMHAEDGEMLQVSRSWTELTGYTLEDASTLDAWLSHAFNEGADSVRSKLEALFAGDVRTINVALEVRTRAGAVRHWSYSASSPGTLRDGRRFIVGMAVDMSERQRAEEELRESEERFRLIIENARDYAMFLLNPENHITFWSTGSARVFGWSEAEAIGQSGKIIFTPEDRENGVMEHELHTALQEGRAEDRRWHLRKDGSRLFLDGALMRLDDAQGQLRGFVKIGRDATAQRVAEETLQQARDTLEQHVAERTAELAASNQALQEEIAQRIQAEQTRQRLSRQLAAAQEEERLRLARDLHDQLGQQITGLQLGLKQLEGAVAGSPGATLLPALQALALELARETHRLAANLRPTLLEDVGFIPALEQLVGSWGAQTGVHTSFHAYDLDQRPMSRDVEVALYRVVQEALTNVHKHAEATSVSVIVERRADQLVVIVEDNGKGFDVDAPRADDEQPPLGILGMRERVGQLGGVLEVESSLESGTTVLVRVPHDARSQPDHA